ncbi:DUF6920 family protein [Nostoc commune]|uniref:DUF6920 family protein n=1 Tax=Nostoc commune TaxID=1178 RepID=UPI0018C58603|nr:DUF6544 family protein [Nostoc commune]MBG1257732.1 hypothetical protein [Nostoc commune BAE]
MWIKWIALICLLMLVGFGLVSLYSRSRWQSGTATLRDRLASGQRSIKPTIYDQKEIEGLPAPVQQFFRTALTDGQLIVAGATFTQQGQFNMDEKKAKWSPFTATQRVITQRPGFDWDARIQMALGLNVFVHDAYVLEEGTLHASLLGLVTLANVRGTPEANQGELMRFFAEAAWYPTALLPSQGVRWDAIDDTSARGTLTDGTTTVSLVFRFNPEGLIDTIHAAARSYRTVGDKLVAMPWDCRVWAYTVRNGMQIPSEGEVAWQLPFGSYPYWIGQFTEINYEFAS